MTLAAREVVDHHRATTASVGQNRPCRIIRRFWGMCVLQIWIAAVVVLGDVLDS